MESDVDEENVNRKRKNDLEADERVNWKKCIICQENKFFEKKSFPFLKELSTVFKELLIVLI